MTTTALLGSSSARPQDGDGVGARGEEGREHRCRGENEGRERELLSAGWVRSKGNGPRSNNRCGPNLKLRFKVQHCTRLARHCCMVGAALPHSSKQWELATN
jgi:hypothetical protein